MCIYMHEHMLYMLRRTTSPGFHLNKVKTTTEFDSNSNTSRAPGCSWIGGQLGLQQLGYEDLSTNGTKSDQLRYGGLAKKQDIQTTAKEASKAKAFVHYLCMCTHVHIKART